MAGQSAGRSKEWEETYTWDASPHQALVLESTDTSVTICCFDFYKSFLRNFTSSVNADGERSFPHNSKQMNMGRVLATVLPLALVSS